MTEPGPSHPALEKEHLELLLRTGEILASSLDMQTILDALMDQVIEAIGAERGFVMLKDEDGGWRIRSARSLDPDVVGSPDFRISRGVLERVTSEGRSVLTSDALQDPRLREQASISLYGLRSILCVPLTVHERVLGVIYADHTMETAVFVPRHRVLLEAIARTAALALENARLYERLQRVHEESVAQARHELEKAHSQLVHSTKMAAVGRLAAGIAHELNTPLSSVQLNVSTLHEQIEDPRQLRRLDLSLQAMERCKAIIQKLLRFSHRSDHPMAAVDVDPVVDLSIALVQHDLEEARVEVRRHGERGTRVRGREGELSQVVVNLLVNACDALRNLPEGRARTVDLDVRTEEGHVLLEITDSGPGIESAVAEHLFEPFFTTRPVGEGLGLGLSITWQIVREHGGEVTVTSPPGAGATFTVRLPSG